MQGTSLRNILLANSAGIDPIHVEPTNLNLKKVESNAIFKCIASLKAMVLIFFSDCSALANADFCRSTPAVFLMLYSHDCHT